MKLDLRPIAQRPGARVPIAFSLDLSGTDWNGGHPFAHPVEVRGEICNRAGALELTAKLTTVLCLVCDRCAKPFEREKTVEYKTLLALELANGESDDVVAADPDGSLDLDGLMREEFLLEMDTKTLCTPDCKGLCPGCGADLNVESCRCKREIDPRLAKLAQLLEPEGERK